MSSRKVVLIDGGYLDKVLKDEFDIRQIDLARFARVIAKSEVLRTYYYHALPLAQDKLNLRTQELDYFESRRSYFQSIERLPQFTVRLGRLAYCGRDGEGKPIFEQKEVDMLTGVDLTRLSLRGRIDEAVLVTGDCDFIPAIESSKDDAVVVRLSHGNPAKIHQRLLDGCDATDRITRAQIEQCRMTKRPHRGRRRKARSEDRVSSSQSEKDSKAVVSGGS